MDSRPSSSSVAKSPGLFSTSASASAHNRLTVSNSSQRRLRALSRADPDELELPQHGKLKSPALLRSLSASPQPLILPIHNAEKPSAPKARKILHWILVVYCIFSVVFFTTRLFSIPESLYKQNTKQNTGSISPINDFPLSYRLSRLLQTEPRPVSFSPFISGPHDIHPEATVTACTWVELEDIRNLESWSAGWEGPLSVVVIISSTTTHQARKLLKELEKNPAIKNKAYFHMIQRRPSETRTANAYLNLARLFARTPFVALFPAQSISPLPEDLYTKLTTKIESFNASQLASPLVLAPSKFKPNSPIPFTPLSPLLVEQSYPIWCSERFFTAPSREDDWEECLWQFWLNSYGNLATLTEPSWRTHFNRTEPKSGATLTSEEIIHRRLSNRFRHESCVLAAKRLKDRSTIPGKVDPRKAQWLRKTCRQVMSSWGKELL